MADYYADSSVLIKRHIPEQGTAWVRMLTNVQLGNRIVTAFITQVEGMSALNRRLRDGTLTTIDYSQMIGD